LLRFGSRSRHCGGPGRPWPTARHHQTRFARYRFATEYRHDKTIQRLANECAKYEEQAVVKQQSVAECQLAAFNYGNALYTLKAEYRK